MMKISKRGRIRHLPLFWFWHCDEAQECVRSQSKELCLHCGRAEPKVMLPERCEGCLAVYDNRRAR